MNKTQDKIHIGMESYMKFKFALIDMEDYIGSDCQKFASKEVCSDFLSLFLKYKKDYAEIQILKQDDEQEPTKELDPKQKDFIKMI